VQVKLDGTKFLVIVLEFCDAGSLEDIMNKRKKQYKLPEKIRLSEKEAIEILH